MQLTKAQVGRLVIQIMYSPNHRGVTAFSAEIRELETEHHSEETVGRLTHLGLFSETDGEFFFEPMRPSNPKPNVRAQYAAKLALAAAIAASTGWDPLSDAPIPIRLEPVVTAFERIRES